MNTKRHYAVIVVGAGPAGLFAALRLADSGITPILLLDAGPDVEERARARGENLLRGWGGAGLFSDGKLNLSPEVGGFLGEMMPPGRAEQFIEDADKLFVRFGAPLKVYEPPHSVAENLKAKAARAGLEFIPTRLRHLGTETCVRVLQEIRTVLEGKVEIHTRSMVRHLLPKDGRIEGVELDTGERIRAKCVICAPGRAGAAWMKEEATKLSLPCRPNPVDVGVRVEVPAAVMQHLTDLVYEAKLIYYSATFDDRVRTFCMNPYGEVVAEKLDGLLSVNGHSYTKRRTDSTNFAILVSTRFTEPFEDPIGYGRHIASLANLLGRGIIVQRLGDLLSGRRSTIRRLCRSIVRPTLLSATPGDLSFVLPYRQLRDIIEMLEAMDTIAPGVFSRHTLLYGVEIKFYSHRVEVGENMGTGIAGLYLAGDGAGITRGLLQAAASGLAAADGALAAEG